MKKVFLFAILLGIATSNAFAQSPRLIKKELKESNSYFQKKDGYTLKYYVYTYLSKEDTLYAAYNLKGKRITPISKKVYYCGAGIFSVKDSPNGYIKGYNTNGELLFPATLKATSIQHKGGEMMLLWFNNDNAPKGQTFALYSSKGKCIIPESMKYDEIIYYYESPNKYILCQYLEKYGNKIQIKICRVYTPDGQWFQEGSYNTYYKRYDLGSTASVGSSEFEFFKRPVSEAIVRSSIDQSRKIEAYESRMASDGNDHYLGITLDANGRASSASGTSTASTYTPSTSSTSTVSSSSSSESSIDFIFNYYYDGVTGKNVFAIDKENEYFFCGQFIMRYEFYNSFFRIRLIAANRRDGTEREVERHVIYPAQCTIVVKSSEHIIVWNDGGKDRNVFIRPDKNMVFLYDVSDLKQQHLFNGKAEGTINTLFNTLSSDSDAEGCTITIEKDYSGKCNRLISRLLQYSWGKKLYK